MANSNHTNGSAAPHDQFSNYTLATLGIHADDSMHHDTDVAPSLHVSTTFRYPRDPEDLVPASRSPQARQTPAAAGLPPSDTGYIYSRYQAPTSSRLELMLSSFIRAPCLTYSSGLAAFHALLVYLNPKVVAIGAGYHGCHGVLGLYQKLTGCKIVDLFDEASWQDGGEGWSLGKGDVVHLESPVNPTGLAFDIELFAARAHRRGAVLTMDATFAPPPLLDPFKWGADYVMHSGTKYFGGHSDMLCGIVAIGRNEGWEKNYWGMLGERCNLGSTLGNMEAWLGVRSLRTMALRVERQSRNAEQVVAFLDACVRGEETGEAAQAVKKVIRRVQHASLQKEDMGWLKKQMPYGFGPVFSFDTHVEEQAKRLPSKLHLFHHATSLGGVESLIEWRHMSDNTVETTLCRVSIGAETWEDLRDDLVQGCKALVAEGW
ncbi:putative transsulfuration enzyme family protein [Neohortaea acidophila]|uniref:Putative transsulfuration enzyme family protein n=1 Tax=Neohortaea acidophila TaxID=245834 RepID=A0A6A6PMF1_9PEZI|nr:putative transsulfuration enzyme family protein [Neohortaea acidophila]KAF2481229.1 putative transsulfuration enzyme family protein [Neohortaea acidophila]